MTDKSLTGMGMLDLVEKIHRLRGVLSESTERELKLQKRAAELEGGIRKLDEWERRTVGEVNDFSEFRRIIRALLDPHP